MTRGLPAASALAARFDAPTPLGHGGFATVLRARDRESGREACLKLVPPEPAGRASERFEHEVAALAAVRHRGVPTLLASEVLPDGHGVLALELVRGESLRAVLRRERQVDVARAVRITCGLLDALAAVHSAGFVHADVKPENVLVEEATGRIVLVDFGLALPIGEAARVAPGGEAPGTPAYMSPEQVRAEPLDARTDLYSAAAVAYELVSGAPPFESPSAAELRRKQLTARPAPLSLAAMQDVPEALDAIVLAGLEKDRARRPARADLMARAIGAI